MNTDRRLRWTLFLVAALAALAVHAGPAAGWIVVAPASSEPLLRELGASVWARHGEFVVVHGSETFPAALESKNVPAIAKVRDEGQWIYLLSRAEDVPAPFIPGAKSQPLSATADLYLIPDGLSIELPSVKPRAAFRAVPRIDLAPVEPHAADVAAAASPGTAELANPLVTAIVNGTSQASWFQFVKDLSGENQVTIGGVHRFIYTRYSDAMFPAPLANAYATEYLLERAAGWGYTGVRESYTNANNGCGQQTRTWQNVVITLPGQVDFGQHQQVIFVTHYDTISFSTAESNSYAPGADDAISGGSALLEALRLFKDYAFKNTVKIIFFSGEEVGLCGSIAYTRQHPAADMWRVVNMDQTAYDGDLNSLMDVYNWSVASSPQSVALGDAFVAANSDYGPIINPANIVRPTNHMCQTDHCPFWDVGVAAIAVTEDLSHNDICPCFDQFQTNFCHDSVTQVDPNHSPRLMFNPDYSWPSEKAAIATVASLAEPMYACPASATTAVATAGNHQVDLSWAALPGVTTYAVERGTTCAGPFTGVASVAGTTFSDTNLANGSAFAYRIRSCPTQTSACVEATPNGPSVTYQAGSATVLADSGDHDNVPDNCELVTMQVNLFNDGNQDLTNVRLESVASSHAAVEVGTTVPKTVGDLLVGQSKPATFKFYLGRNGNSAACGEAIPFTVSSGSDQSPEAVRGFSVVSERDTTAGTFSYGFESDLSGWTVSTGSFTRVAGGAPGSTAFSLHSRDANNICDAIVSPTIVPSATSTMSMQVNYSIESPPQWDRAVVRAVNLATGVKTLLTPTGAAYTTTAASTTNLCDGIGPLSGWAGNLTTWTQANFNLASFAGVPIQIEVRYSTDGSVLGTPVPQGFWFDAVQITNASQIGCDAGSNVCNAIPAEVSPTGDPVPFTLGKNETSFDLTFSEIPGATKYNVYAGTLASLESGVYDHGAAPGLCGFVDPVPGDDSVLVPVPGDLPEDSYFLVVASDGSLESPYGTATAGSIPTAVSTCP